jgi:hypothetical protein
MVFAIQIIIAGWYLPVTIGMPDNFYLSFHVL